MEKRFSGDFTYTGSATREVCKVTKLTVIRKTEHYVGSEKVEEQEDRQEIQACQQQVKQIVQDVQVTSDQKRDAIELRDDNEEDEAVYEEPFEEEIKTPDVMSNEEASATPVKNSSPVKRLLSKTSFSRFATRKKKEVSVKSGSKVSKTLDDDVDTQSTGSTESETVAVSLQGINALSNSEIDQKQTVDSNLDMNDNSSPVNSMASGQITEGINCAIEEPDEDSVPVVSGFGNFFGHVWSYMKTTVQHYFAPDSDDEEWQDYKVSESDTDEETYEDAAEDIATRNRIHNICNELMTTERDYVRRIGVLVMVKKAVEKEKLFKPVVVKTMFQNIETIHQFHHDNLLPQLEERLQFWEKHRKIGDIMKKFAPYLKLYTEYVKNFEKASAVVDSHEEKTQGFAALLKKTKENPEYGRLKVQAHMLEPVQRIPRYELLLRDYLKRIPENSPDRPDAQEALKMVSNAASHFESMMKRDSLKGELMALQSQLDGPVSIVSGKRELLKRGKVSTVSARRAKPAERIAFLFNDMLLICSEQALSVPGMSSRYKVKHVLELQGAVIADGNNLDIPNTFYIKTTETVIELHLSSDEEFTEWKELITKQLKEFTKDKLRRNPTIRPRDGRMHRDSIGKRAPVPVHLNSVSQCMVCVSEFGTLRRKHHCRACGAVICNKCSSHSSLLPYDPSKPLRICDQCFVNQQEGDATDAGKSIAKPKNNTEGVCLQRGMMNYSMDAGKSWKLKKTLAVHDAHILYSFKAPQDINPLTSISLKGFTCQLCELPLKKVQGIELKGSGKTYYMQTESPESLQKWFESIKSVIPKTETEQQPET